MGIGVFKGKKKERGQASVMIAMMMLTYLFLFAFVVNTGMLVHAKINLQNAADLAAYAGAAVQARQLNQISFLNYEMRRQYKKFLFRYYVMGNMAQDSFPKTGGGNASPVVWSPDGQTQNDYTFPAVCVIFNSKDNFCHLPKLPKITIPPDNLLDQINSTLIGQLKNIEFIRQQNCVSIGKLNIDLLILWLYNTDPTGADSLFSAAATSGGGNAELQQIVTTIRGMAQGLGLIPREFILRQRIETLKTYINSPVQTKVTKNKADSLTQFTDPAFYERTIQAFYSAYNTLGNHLYNDDSSIIMDELMPSGNSGAELIELQDIKSVFDTYAVDFYVATQNPNTTQPGDCSPQLIPVVVSQPVPLGVYKNPSILTYYAIRLKAKAKLLFSPIGDITLKAYSAAQPFGSRIGPQSDGSDFVRIGVTVPPNFQSNAQNFNPTGRIPNLPVLQQDSTGKGKGWDSQQVVGEFYQRFSPPGAQGQIQLIDDNAITRGLDAAMVPNPFEVGKYNIPSDLGNDPFVRNFDTNLQFFFWAPLFDPTAPGPANDLIKKAIDDYFVSVPGQAAANNPTIVATFKKGLQQGISNYLGKLSQQQGELREGTHLAVITDPFFAVDPANPSSASQMIPVSPTLMIKDPKQVKTSYVNTNDSDIAAEGRVGYSVKFVSFGNLTNQMLSSDGKTNPNNKLSMDDPETQQDLSSPFFKH